MEERGDVSELRITIVRKMVLTLLPIYLSPFKPCLLRKQIGSTSALMLQRRLHPLNLVLVVIWHKTWTVEGVERVSWGQPGLDLEQSTVLRPQPRGLFSTFSRPFLDLFVRTVKGLIVRLLGLELFVGACACSQRQGGFNPTVDA